MELNAAQITPQAELRKQIESRIETVPDTANGKVRIHLTLSNAESGGDVKGVIGLSPAQAVKLATSLHSNAAFVMKYRPRKKP